MILKIVSFFSVYLFFMSVQAAHKVYFISPKNNAIVEKTFKVKFGQKGLNVKPAGEDINNKKSGHYHIIVDAAFTPEGQAVPADANHIHYGKAQTEAELTLTSGKHTLTLQFADGAHLSYGKKLSDTITVNVK